MHCGRIIRKCNKKYIKYIIQGPLHIQYECATLFFMKQKNLFMSDIHLEIKLHVVNVKLVHCEIINEDEM